MRYALCISTLLLVAYGCRPSGSPSAVERSSSSVYTVINETTIPGIKRTLDIRLSNRVSEETLRSIAEQLKTADPAPYERTFIGFYLPDMPVNAGYWATTHFNPDLEVRILGLTAEQSERLNQVPSDDAREVVGNWLDETPLLGCRVTIYRQHPKVFMENSYPDSSVLVTELVESANGTRFDYPSELDRRDYFMVDSDGNLQIWDDSGLISTAKRVE